MCQRAKGARGGKSLSAKGEIRGMTIKGQLADVTLTAVHHGSGPGTATINEFAVFNSGGTACPVRMYWNGTLDSYVELGPNEKTILYKDRILDGTDSLALRADLPGAINYTLNLSR
jgi:hypothetical protein